MGGMKRKGSRQAGSDDQAGGSPQVPSVVAGFQHLDFGNSISFLICYQDKDRVVCPSFKTWGFPRSFDVSMAFTIHRQTQSERLSAGEPQWPPSLISNGSKIMTPALDAQGIENGA